MKLLFLLLAFATLLSALTCEVESGRAYQNCSGAIEIAADPEGSLGVETLRFRSDLFEKPAKTSLGYVNGNVWSRVKIHSAEAVSLLVVNPKSNINTIDAYVFESGHLSGVYKLGNVHDPSARSINSKYSHFPLELGAGETCEIYTCYRSRSVIDVSYFLTTQPFFLMFMMYENLLWGVFIGLVAALIIYGTAMFSLLRDHTYAAYVSHVVFALLFQLSTHGIFYQIGLYGDTKIYNTISWITAYGSILSILLFSMLFFNTRVTMPSLHRVLSFFFAASASLLLLFLAAFLEPDVVTYFRTLTKFFAIVELLMLLFVGVVAVRKKLSGAKLYLAGHGFFILTLIYQQINGIVNVEINLFNVYGTALGFLVEVIFLSLALNKKVEAIKKEKERAEALLITQSGFSSIGKTIGNISHQMKVPMVHMGTLLTRMESIMVQERHQSRELEATQEKMRQTLKFMSESIRELNRFYADVNQQREYRPAAEILSIIEMLSAKTAFVHASVTRDMDESITLFGYKNAFSNAILIIIDNALDIFRERQIRQGRVTVTCFSEGTSTVVRIGDNGGGITLNPVESVFDIFVSQNEGGSGMGLTMAKILVEERLLGSLSVRNGVEGAVFELRIPCAGVTCKT